MCIRDRYVPVKTFELVGLCMLLFVRAEILDRISHFDFHILKLGVGGQLGNKGALAVRFNLDDSTLGFINCHLEAGGGKLQERLSQFTQIHTKAFQMEGIGRQKSCLLYTSPSPRDS
eukprot:TRINITY_DN19777_c0_g1_i1.p2 TRINITY_DN19777_c0_g1~~TRINITY_DN19777_c0_g1_i1.p2  ORF type:complete len:117 (+),score=20.51 TRINITY_DN19777_c0_g1_i1:61-411(+)